MPPDNNYPLSWNDEMMREQWLTVGLLDSLVVSATGATATRHRCLDYLPGSVFWGAVASHCIKTLGIPLFFDGSLRFGPALPVSDDHDRLVFPVPFSYHRQKGQSYTLRRAVNGLDPREVDDEIAKGIQIEQMRSGGVTTNFRHGRVRKGWVQKNALDREKYQAAKKERLYHYEYLQAGQSFAMRLSADDTVPLNVFNEIVETLCTREIRLGRSHNAEFGRVAIKEAKPFHLPPPEAKLPLADRCHFYLVSDLALFTGNSSRLIPQPEDFLPQESGFSASAEFLPGESYLRSRRYAPWNNFHRCREQERHVLERGSVLTFKLNTPLSKEAVDRVQCLLMRGVGGYRNEGLGWALLNPGFVVQPENFKELRIAACGRESVPEFEEDVILLAHVMQRASGEDDGFKDGLEWAGTLWKMQQDLVKRTRSVPGKTQWNNIRMIAVACKNNPDGIRKHLDDYFDGGRRKSIWRDSTVREGGHDLSLADVIHEKLGEHPGLGEIRALLYATKEMNRKLSRQEQVD